MSIFNSLKGLITPELISSAASMLGEDSSKVTSAVSSVVPGLLGSLLNAGDNPIVKSALEAAGNSTGLLGSIGDIFGGKTDTATEGIGSGFLKAILGEKLAPFVSMISGSSGLSLGNAGKLISSIAPIVAGFLGGKMKTEGLSLTNLLKGLVSEKSSFGSLIPSGLTNVLGISSLDNLGSNLLNTASSTVNQATNAVESVAKNSMSWLKWFIPLALILAAGLFFWRSCGNKAATVTSNAINNSVAAVESKANQGIKAVEKVLSELSLPNGVKLNAFSGGLEDNIIKFLSSDEFKNADAEALKDKWFDFDNINFKTGTAELAPESKAQMDNLVAILKSFNSAKVKIGAYTDKTGNDAANLKLSQSRADAIKKMLSDAGISSQITGAEGYGSQYATVSAGASDAERAIDRKIAIRFVK